MITPTTINIGMGRCTRHVIGTYFESQKGLDVHSYAIQALNASCIISQSVAPSNCSRSDLLTPCQHLVTSSFLSTSYQDLNELIAGAFFIGT